MLDNINNTFVTPVFNGSASLRDAAGQLIENTVKAVRRNQTVDEAYMEKLYADTIALYRLDQLENQSGASDAAMEDLGPLPQASVILISVLITVWVLIGLYALRQFIKNRKNQE